MNTEEQIRAFHKTYSAMRQEIGKVIVGHDSIVEGTLYAWARTGTGDWLACSYSSSMTV